MEAMQSLVYYINPKNQRLDPPKKMGLTLHCIAGFWDLQSTSFEIPWFLEKQPFWEIFPTTVGKLRLHCLVDWSISVPLAWDDFFCMLREQNTEDMRESTNHVVVFAKLGSIYGLDSSKSFIMNMYMFMWFYVNVRMMVVPRLCRLTVHE